jgi:hypothetical protein
MRVYKIETDLTTEKNNDILKNLSDEDSLLLRGLDIKTSVDLLNENNFLTTIMVTDIINLEKLKDYFTKIGVKYDIEDISDEFEDITNINEEEILNKFGL